MTRPVLGEKAKVIFEAIEQALVEAQALLFDTAIDIYEGEKAQATDELKQISDRCTYASRLATLARSGQLTEAENLIIERKLQRRKPNHD